MKRSNDEPSYPSTTLVTPNAPYFLAIPVEDRLPKTCINCQCSYLEAMEIGKLNCRFHPGVIIQDVNTLNYMYTYSCCGVGVRSSLTEGISGCVRCDHMNDENMVTNEMVSSDNTFECNKAFQNRYVAIKQFATTIIPSYMFDSRVLLMPFRENIIYSFSPLKPSIQSSNISEGTFNFELNALETSKRNYCEMMGLRYDTFSPHSNKKVFVEHDYVDVMSHIESFDLTTIGKEFTLQSINSPVYQIFIADLLSSSSSSSSSHKNSSASGSKDVKIQQQRMKKVIRGKTIDTRSNKIWKYDIKPKEKIEEVDDDLEGGKDDKRYFKHRKLSISEEEYSRQTKKSSHLMSYYIIKRIDNTLKKPCIFHF
jgi:hypothetical protein